MASRVGVVLLALAFSASADQTRMDVDAELIGTCEITEVRAIDFGDLEQSAASPNRFAGGRVFFWCTRGMRYQIAVDLGLHSNKGSRRMKGEGTANTLEYLTYQLRSLGGATGTGGGLYYPEVFDMEAEVLGVNYDPLSVGPLRDTVVVTISP
jgi:spore coat protein U-like protein